MSQRLEIALDAQSVALPEGRIAVFAPRGNVDLSLLGRERVQVIQGFKPDHDAFARAGYDCTVAANSEFAAAMVFLPRSKTQARALIAEAAAYGGLVIVDGQKTDGIDSMLKAVRKRTETGAVISKAHGKLFTFEGGDFSDWVAQDGRVGDFVTRPGVFSADKIDRGSEALIAALPKKLPKRVIDLGAGWGFLSRAILERDGVEHLELVEADHAALECARLNVTDPRAAFHWADANRFRPDAMAGAVITNPPFHTGRSGDPDLGRAFIKAAAGLLTPSGEIYLVANRHLPYEATLAELFRNVEELPGNSGFKILHGSKLLRGRR
jgi:16S rRNA (guanine1207-N2)-methyltransferase